MTARHQSAEAYHGIGAKTATDRDNIAQLVRVSQQKEEQPS